MTNAKSLLVNAAAALGNLVEALYWTKLTFLSPTPDYVQSAAECYLKAGENILLTALSCIPREKYYQNMLGMVLNGMDISTTAMALDTLAYRPRTISGMIQPMVNLVGTVSNTFEFLYYEHCHKKNNTAVKE